MKWFFNVVTTLSLRFRYLTLLAVVLFLGLGVQSLTALNQELLPPIDLPQTIILAPASGMTGEQVLNVVTTRFEQRLSELDQVINLESTTTDAFGAVFTAFNDFGIDQEALRNEIQRVIDEIWLPIRVITPLDDSSVEAMLAELPADILIYIAETDPNFLFQLEPEVWSAFSDDTLQGVIAYLASRANVSGDTRGALQRLVESEFVREIENLADIANVTISGGQVLPGQESLLAVDESEVEDFSEGDTLLLRLSPEAWSVISERFDSLNELDNTAIEAVSDVEFEIPTDAPVLPDEWLQDHFHNADDLLELSTFTTSMADFFNDFIELGYISGPLGQTDDLTPEIVRQYLEIDPTLVNYFSAEHLSAMTPEVLDVVFEYPIQLDGFARDALAAASLAQDITGQDIDRVPVDLPDAWRVQPPQLITFSFADIPLASFSVSTTGVIPVPRADTTEDVIQETSDTDGTSEVVSDQQEISAGPELPAAIVGIGSVFGVELETARDLLSIQMPEQFVTCFMIETISASNLLNLLVSPFPIPDASALPEGCEGLSSLMAVSDGAGQSILGAMTPELMIYLAEYEADFLTTISPAVYGGLSDEVLLTDGLAPPLDSAWSVLANQPQFVDTPLATAADVVAIGDGEASQVLNTINENIPNQFEGYEVRLFDSLTPGVVRYFALVEPNFYANIDGEVIQKFSAETLAILPDDYVSSLDSEIADELIAIVNGESESAFSVLEAELYSSDVIPPDPTAPVLNSQWQTIAGFLPAVQQLDNAFDLFRFPEATGTPAQFINGFFDTSDGRRLAPGLLGNLSVEAFTFISENSPSFIGDLRAEAILLLSDDVKVILSDEVLVRAQAGGQRFTPADEITRTDGALSLLVTVFKTQDANTVQTFHAVEDIIFEIANANENLEAIVAFEQSSFIEESISGVAREGVLGAVFAIVIILIFLSAGKWELAPRRRAGMGMLVFFIAMAAIFVAIEIGDIVWWTIPALGFVGTALVLLWPSDLPDPAWRATIVIAVSIPLSILTAFVGMKWFSPAMYDLISPLAENSDFFNFLLRMFPENLTLNIMTLSGLTVAVGRVVDDSIVVLENIFRQMQSGESKQKAILEATRDVSSAIFVATIIAVVVFLPLGLTGGIIGEFFLPFGLAVTYALAGSFIVAVTVVPVMAYLLLDTDDIPEESDIWIASFYLPILRWSLSSWFSRIVVVALAILSIGLSGILFSQRPFAFLPDFGEPQVAVMVDMPPSTSIIETNALVEELEQFITETVPEDELGTIQTTVGGSGIGFASLVSGGSSVSENLANLTIGFEVSGSALDHWTQVINDQAIAIFGDENVEVSAASAADGGFGGLAIVVSGPQDQLEALDPLIIETMNSIDGLSNAESNLSDAQAGGGITYIRVNGESALSYTAELETENTIGVTQEAIIAIENLPELTDGIMVGEGFQSELQTQGFQSLFVAMSFAMLIVIVIFVVTFMSPVYWLAVIFSVIVAPVGAAIALTVTDRVLGISALIGLLMLLGLVITNAVVLLDRVRSNRTERGMDLHNALIEAGSRRLRPILMTSLTTIIALMPLTIGLSDGAIIASELGTVVVGGIFSSTLLTLVVVPVMYSILHPVHSFFSSLVGIKATN